MERQSVSNEHAIVIGGSMAGLMAARVLSEHFGRVAVLERDKVNDFPEARKGQPQTRHLHALLARGYRIMTRYFPDLPEALEAEGATVADIAELMHWYAFGGYRRRHTSGLRGAAMSRPLLEWKIRQRVAALPNVTILDECGVKGLMANEDRSQVVGVRLTRRKEADREDFLHADLVVDASGRGSHAGAWLEALGYPRAEERVVRVDVGYATRLYRRREHGARDLFFITPEAPKERRIGGAFPIEGSRWLVGLGGWHGEHAPADERGFLEFAKGLPTSDIYDLITRSESLSEIVLHKFPSSLRRHYEKLDRFPEGYLVLGDAICSFNPVYGQGMTVAALEAEALDALLGERRGNLDGIAKPFFRRAARIVDKPWGMAVGEDFRFPETKGERGFATDFLNAYTALVQRATHHDPVVCRAFLSVINLMAPSTRLLAPDILMRMLWGWMRSYRASTRQEPMPAVVSRPRR